MGSSGEFYPELDPVIFNLSAGEHTLRIIQRKDGAKLDRLLITNNMSYVPPYIEPDTTPPYTTGHSPAKDAIEVAKLS